MGVRRERGITPADILRVEEKPAEALAAPQSFQRGTVVGNNDEPLRSLALVALVELFHHDPFNAFG